MAMSLKSSTFMGTQTFAPSRSSSRRSTSTTQAIFKKKAAPVQKEAPKPKKQSIMEALDFSQVRSKEDEKLLYDARYGKLEGGKMSREQYAALRRKVGGTARDFWKGWVDVEGKYVDEGYVTRNSSTAKSVSGLPFLIAVTGAVVATTAYIATAL